MGTLIDTSMHELSQLSNAQEAWIEAFYTKRISLNFSDYEDTDVAQEHIEKLTGILLGSTPKEVIKIIKKVSSAQDIITSDIPQFSDLAIAAYSVPKLLSSYAGEPLTFERIGELLWPTERKAGANLKYGENHAKTAAMLGIVEIKNNKASLNEFGHYFLSLNSPQQELLIPMLFLRLPLFQNYFQSEDPETTLKKDISILSESTQKRRMSNIRSIIDVIEKGYFPNPHSKSHIKPLKLESLTTSPPAYLRYLRAARTKPFLLLAGISGTGKSRIVKQMAFDCCPGPDDHVLRKDPTSPGNYCLIEVKPNWHDSTELLGYESKIGGAHYQLTPFIKFLVKAMLYPDVPFFVCLDEMNLAPVEQYFAEFLSVLESRIKIDDHIVSEPLIQPTIFSNTEYENELQHQIFDVQIKSMDAQGIRIYDADLTEDELRIYKLLKQYGLRIPENVIVIGTVNMDETTHQFSRKVIDRAMTIEMNLPDGNPFMDFFEDISEMSYRSEPMTSTLFLPTETKSSAIIKLLEEEDRDKTEWLKAEIAKQLTELNHVLEGTPFKIAYRVQNELVLYFYQLWLEDKNAEWESILKSTFDEILMMKVLPRIEGDDEMLQKPLEMLTRFTIDYPNASKKLQEMNVRLEKSHYVSFWP